MVNPESDDPELISIIERFLAGKREEEGESRLEATAQLVESLLSDGGWETMRDEVVRLARLWTLRSDFTSKAVTKDESVRHAPRLTEQNQRVLELINKVGYAREGIYKIVDANGRPSASLRSVVAPIPIDSITLSQFRLEELPYISEETQALGITDSDAPITRISITGIISGLTDRQTRPAMEAIFSQYPNAAQVLSTDIETKFYIFGDRIGKIVNRPAPLLAGRTLNTVLKNSAVSEFSSGDEFLTRVALQTLTDKMLSLR